MARTHDCRACGKANGLMHNGDGTYRPQEPDDGVAHRLREGLLTVSLKAETNERTMFEKRIGDFCLCPECATIFLDELRERGWLKW